jgi:hypothetical protein
VFIALFPIKAPIYFVQFAAKVVDILMGLLPKLLSIGGKMAAFIGHGIAAGASAIWGWVKGLPAKLESAVTAVAGQLASVGAKIAGEITKGFYESLPGPLKGALGKAKEGFEAVNPFAAGTNFAPGGIALVGERGPELVNLPRGSQVITASRTRHILDKETHVGPLRHRGGPSPVRAENAGVRGAGSRRRPRPVEVRVPVSIGRRQFGEGMAMAMIDEEENE